MLALAVALVVVVEDGNKMNPDHWTRSWSQARDEIDRKNKALDRKVDLGSILIGAFIFVIINWWFL